jgi:hypothetical protein
LAPESSVSSGLAIFGYGSLVSPASAAVTLGRPVEVRRARLSGWRRGWTVGRHNLMGEKTFAPVGDEPPFEYCLGLNVEPEPGLEEPLWPNGCLIDVTAAELERLDRRELRYDRDEVTADVRVAGGLIGAAAVFTFRSRPGHRYAEPPPDAVIIAQYLRTVERAFEALGPGELEAFRRSTGEPPVRVAEAELIRDEIPEGNPKQW